MDYLLISRRLVLVLLFSSSVSDYNGYMITIDAATTQTFTSDTTTYTTNTDTTSSGTTDNSVTSAQTTRRASEITTEQTTEGQHDASTVTINNIDRTASTQASQTSTSQVVLTTTDPRVSAATQSGVSTTSLPQTGNQVAPAAPSDGNIAITSIVLIGLAILVLLIVVFVSRTESKLSGIEKTRKLSIFDASRRSDTSILVKETMTQF